MSPRWGTPGPSCTCFAACKAHWPSNPISKGTLEAPVPSSPRRHRHLVCFPVHTAFPILNGESSTRSQWRTEAARVLIRASQCRDYIDRGGGSTKHGLSRWGKEHEKDEKSKGQVSRRFGREIIRGCDDALPTSSSDRRAQWQLGKGPGS